MKHILLCLLLAPGLIMAQKKTKLKGENKVTMLQDSYIINGTISGFDDGTVVDLLSGNGQPEGTTTITGGKFILKGKVPFPDYKLLTINKSQPYIPVFLDNSSIQITAKKESLASAVITGSTSHNEFLVYDKIVKAYEEFFQQDAPEDSAKRKAGANAFEKFAMQNKGSFVSPIAVYRNYQLIGNGEKMETLFNKLAAPVKSTPVGDYIKKEIADYKRSPMGKVLPDFSQPDTSGKDFKFSSLKGKYVLVDFWASWCGPCRQENPNVVAAYNRYKDKNFTVLGVSLDRARQPWIDAIQKDNLTWYHISDLLFWQNAVAKQFGIESIPQNFLVDPNGVVVAKNLRGSALEIKLASLLNK